MAGSHRLWLQANLPEALVTHEIKPNRFLGEGGSDHQPCNKHRHSHWSDRGCMRRHRRREQISHTAVPPVRQPAATAGGACADLSSLLVEDTSNLSLLASKTHIPCVRAQGSVRVPLPHHTTQKIAQPSCCNWSTLKTRSQTPTLLIKPPWRHNPVLGWQSRHELRSCVSRCPHHPGCSCCGASCWQAAKETEAGSSSTQG
jgi:hypothetical protein